MTMTLVSTITVGAGGAASIEFTGIPQTGTDLLLVYSGRSTYSTNVFSYFSYNFNGVTTTYTHRKLQGNGSSALSNTDNAFINGTGSTASTFGSLSFYVPNYTSAVAKTASIDFVTENNATEAYSAIVADAWNGTSAITSLSLTFGTIQQYSTASLYTITKGSGGATVS